MRLLGNTLNGADFYILLGDFLDEFYRAPASEKQKMICDPPLPPHLRPEELSGREIHAFAAATAHKLANDFCLEVPPWVFDKKYYLTDKPFFGCGAKGNLRLLFMYKSPAEFKHRNLFVDENVLSRV